jgi:tRNA-Thr(GGU) m(6)t(6)A37 methyltransferase TsaA
MQNPEMVFDALALNEGDTILDMGCGPGDYAIRASEIVGDSGVVYALDRWQDVIEELAEKARSRGLKNIRAIVSDITERLPVDDESVDICFISTVLHSLNLTDIERALFGEVRRVLKRGGRLAIIECKKEEQPFGPPIAMRLSSEQLESSIVRYGFEMMDLVDLGCNYMIIFSKILSENDAIPGLETEDKTPLEMTLLPVGIIKNRVDEPFLVAGGAGLEMRGELDATMKHVREVREAISEIVIDETLAGVLDGIEEYSHLVVLYWAHKVPEEGRSLTRVHPMGRADIPEVGIFSTCSPARPNPVLTTVVRLSRRRENVLEVAGLDAVDGSPVIDIKPYVKDSYPQEGVGVPDWMERLQEEVRGRGRMDG